jgi:hypothetical protein
MRYVFVVEEAQEFDFTERAQAKHGVVKGRDLFDGDLLARGLVNGRSSEMR